VSIFDPGGNAEDQMSKAFGCVGVTIIGAVVAVIVGIFFLVKAVF
jgi:hypothetical protein